MKLTKDQVEWMASICKTGAYPEVVASLCSDWLEQEKRLELFRSEGTTESVLQNLAGDVRRIDEWSESPGSSVPWTAIEDVCETLKTLIGGEK